MLSRPLAAFFGLTLVLSLACSGAKEAAEDALEDVTGDEKVDADASTKTNDDADDDSWMKGLPSSTHVDPATDETLEEIFDYLNDLTTEQTHEIASLYITLRDDQYAVMDELSGGGKGGKGGKNGGKGGKNGGKSGGGKAGKSGGRMVFMEVDMLNKAFLSDGRALMREDQYNSWDDCASAIDLMPGELQGRGNSGSNPGDGPDEGSKPANFTLETLDGETVNLNDFRGKPVVVQFGSYTCPAFRYEVDPLDKVMEEYGDKVAWLLVYGYEAHASDGKVSKDNVEAGIEVPTHKTLADREAAARTARRELDLTYPILIDGMDDAVTNAWDGHPNHGWVLDADGVVVSKQQRIQAETVREALDELL